MAQPFAWREATAEEAKGTLGEWLDGFKMQVVDGRMGPLYFKAWYWTWPASGDACGLKMILNRGRTVDTEEEVAFVRMGLPGLRAVEGILRALVVYNIRTAAGEKCEVNTPAPLAQPIPILVGDLVQVNGYGIFRGWRRSGKLVKASDGVLMLEFQNYSAGMREIVEGDSQHETIGSPWREVYCLVDGLTLASKLVDSTDGPVETGWQVFHPDLQRVILGVQEAT